MGLLSVLGLNKLPPAAARPAARGQDPGEKFNARLAQMLPTIKDAIAAVGPLAQQIKQKALAAGALAARKDFAGADAMLDEAAALLREATRSLAPAPKALPVWTAAKDEVAAQIAKLQTAFRNTGRPLALRVADKALTGLTQRLQVGHQAALQAALIEFDNASVDKRAQAAAKLRTATGNMKRFLATDPMLPLLEENPLGVLVTIRSTLTTALITFEKAT
jgi:hypothetical protein